MDWLSEHAWQVWLGAAMVLAGLEMLSLDLILIMLAAGAVVGMVAALLDAPFAVQALAAAAASVAALAVVRPSVTKRLHGGPELRLGHGKLVGEHAVVTTGMSGTTPGLVRLDGESWTAMPYDEHLTIPAGATVQVLEIRGATAYVHPVDELTP